MQAQVQQQILPRADPIMQAVIEADFRPVDLTLDSANVAALCAVHSREKCDECDIDYTQLNRLSKVLAANPTLHCPPPPNVVNQKLSQIINQTKEEGNVCTFVPHERLSKYVPGPFPNPPMGESHRSLQPSIGFRVPACALGGPANYARGAFDRPLQPLCRLF